MGPGLSWQSGLLLFSVWPLARSCLMVTISSGIRWKYQLTWWVILNEREIQLSVVLLSWGSFASVGCLCDHPAPTQMQISAPPQDPLKDPLTQVSSWARSILLKLLQDWKGSLYYVHDFFQLSLLVFCSPKELQLSCRKYVEGNNALLFNPSCTEGPVCLASLISSWGIWVPSLVIVM